MSPRELSSVLFDYHLKLHHTQTGRYSSAKAAKFDYHLKLHHTQTEDKDTQISLEFDYHLKLHHTQTVSDNLGGIKSLTTI